MTRRVAKFARRWISLTGAPLVAFVGNGFGRKGLRFLIAAWPRVARGAHLLVVGADQKSRWYQREAIRLGVGARIHFAGPMSDVTQIFHGVDAVALPSLFEPFGNVVMEAMASGVPVLSSAQSGASELLPESLQRFVVRDPTDSNRNRSEDECAPRYRRRDASTRARHG